MERVSAKQVIFEAFVGLAATKPVDKITVREICRAAGVSSVTFYNHFADKTDLYSWESRQVAASMLARLGDDLTWREYLVSVFEGNLDARDVLPNLVNNTHGYESFANINARNHAELLTSLISRRHPGHPDDRELVALRSYLYGLTNVLADWIRSGMRGDHMVLVDGLCDAVPACLASHLSAE